MSEAGQVLRVAAHDAPRATAPRPGLDGDAATDSLVINGRFLTQPVTGVQRFATEILNGLDQLAAAGAIRIGDILTPRSDAPPQRPGHLGLRATGRLRGNAWEQVELAPAADGAMILNLGNTGPLRAGRRQIVVIHDAGAFDTPESYSLPFRLWYRSLHRGLALLGARIVTVSAFSRTRLAERLRIPAERIAVMGEGADHMLRAPADPAALDRHGLRPGGYALAVGSRAQHKNLGALSASAQLLAARGMTLAIVGSLDASVFRQGADGVDFPALALGRVSDAELRALYESAACLLFPSRYEGYGLPPVEAMACGCPVLAAPGHAVEEICGDAALYADCATPAGPAAALARLLDETGLAADLRARGLQRAQPLRWENAAAGLAAIIRQAGASA
ncbi:glycosyltransferase family 4 protein [Plastoroseomonas arctica]|uniref:Glycosyltransferase family 4 protein n=1 Tax=Plastoroseomonas arctica TaxID=1509237 RepID=A0AAF1KNC2_9PROT|nr:glycosyltransferase family 1 protein [Plastoroseomonas arctica]MBR0657401.1 glycosyltransferase family 4 protein [Plastoroseomonas arctica]